MSSLRFFFLIGSIVFVLFNCDFEPTGENYVDIDTDNLYLNFNIVGIQDTIFIAGINNYRLDTVGLGGRTIRRGYIYLDRVLIDSIGGRQLSFTIDARYLFNGSHKVQIELSTNSHTGSLADILGYEYLQLTKEWTIVVDNLNPLPITQINFTFEEGLLKLDWEKRTKLGIDSYIIKRNETTLGSVVNLENPVFYDTTFLGGTSDYRIDLRFIGKNIGGTPVSYSDIQNNYLRTDYLPGNKVRVFWNKQKYYRAVSKYELFSSGRLLFSTRTDTSFIDTTRIFDEAVTYILSVNENSVYLFNDSEPTGSALPQLYDVQGNNDATQLFLISDNSIFSYNPEDMTLLGQVQTTSPVVYSAFSRNGKYFYYSTSASDRILFNLDPDNFENNSINFLNDLGLDIRLNFWSGFSISDDNILAIQALDNTNQTSGSYIFSMDELQLIYHRMDSFDTKPCISHNNKYCMMDYKLFRIENNNFIYLYDMNEHFYDFLEDGEKFLSSDEIFLTIRSSETNEIINALQLEDVIFKPSYDLVTGNIGLRAERGFYYIYSPDLSQQLFKMRTSENTAYILYNNTIFSSMGYYYKLLENPE